MTVSSPFPDEDQEQPLTERVKRRRPMWHILDHAGAGYQAKAFVARLLEFNPVKRISMEEALDDPWLFPQFSKGSQDMLQQYFGGVDSSQDSQGFEHLPGRLQCQQSTR
jgi:serine/threonine protein kinase